MTQVLLNRFKIAEILEFPLLAGHHPNQFVATTVFA
jgi:hypothetical protein